MKTDFNPLQIKKQELETVDFTPRHVAVAAEAIVAGQFARIGFDISVKYGADQPEYDLIIAKKNKMLKVSVKGSKDGSWGLTQKYKKKVDYHQAVDLWYAKHTSKTIFCFVQFKEIKLYELPRIYLATPTEIADRLNETAKGRDDTMLYEEKTYIMKRAAGYGTCYRSSILPGSVITPFSSPKMPSTAIPSNLNGSVSIQKPGYSTKAKIASGQQRIKRMIQAIKVNIG